MTGCVIVSVGGGGLNRQTDEAGRWLSETLLAHGIPASVRQVIEDDESALEAVLRWAIEHSPLVLVLGQQADTGGEAIRRVLSRVTGNRLILSNQLLDSLEAEYGRREEAMPRRADKLALVPQGALLWPTIGGEPAFAVETSRGAVVVLPTSEEALTLIVEKHLLPYARERLDIKDTTLSRTFKVAGLSIGEVEEKLEAEPTSVNWSITCLEADGDVEVRLKARGPTRAAAETALAHGEAMITGRLGDAIYGRDKDILEEVVGRLLKERRLMVSVAESCTGGLLAHRLTNVPGSSTYFERGVVVYSNQAKEALLGVPADLLRQHGAVSGPVAESMARGIRRISKIDLGVSITGIAGPDGGTPAKPVGTVFIALASAEGTEAKRFRFRGDRGAIKWRSTQMALEMLRQDLMKRTKPRS